MLTSSGAPPPRTGNGIDLLSTGEDAYRAMIDLILQARRSIHLSTLILAGDEVGTEIVARIAEKARAGVEVRVLVDALFRFRTPRRLLRMLRAAGARTAWFMPLWHLPFRGHANLRLHRKALVVDGQTDSSSVCVWVPSSTPVSFPWPSSRNEMSISASESCVPAGTGWLRPQLMTPR